MQERDRKQNGLGDIRRCFEGGRLEKQVLTHAFELVVPIFGLLHGRQLIPGQAGEPFQSSRSKGG